MCVYTSIMLYYRNNNVITTLFWFIVISTHTLLFGCPFGGVIALSYNTLLSSMRHRRVITASPHQRRNVPAHSSPNTVNANVPQRCDAMQHRSPPPPPGSCRKINFQTRRGGSLPYIIPVFGRN